MMMMIIIITEMEIFEKGIHRRFEQAASPNFKVK